MVSYRVMLFLLIQMVRLSAVSSQIWQLPPDYNYTVVECDPPTANSYTSFSPCQTRNNYSDTITYRCDLGYYYVSGNNTSTCNEFGLWTGTTMTCSNNSANTCIQEDSPFMTTVPDQLLHDVYTDIVYTCIQGYNHSDGDVVRTCQADGQWNGTLPDCEIVECDPPTANIYTSFAPYQTRYNYGDTTTYSCDLGYYYVSGNNTSMCNEFGLWTGTPMTCSNNSANTCIQEDSPFMTTVPDQLLHDVYTDIVYTCIQGYNHSDGDVVRTCQADGQWNGTLPDCEIVECDPPAANIYTSFTPDWTLYIYCDTTTYSCDLGYYYVSGDNASMCNEFGLWTGTAMTCSTVQCANPVDANAYNTPDQSFYDFNTSIESTCVIGYNLSGGDEIRICQANGTWGGTPPNCAIVECDLPAPDAISRFSPLQSVYIYLDVITWTCVIGYVVTIGDSSRQCEETGLWSGSAPICTNVNDPVEILGLPRTVSVKENDVAGLSIVNIPFSDSDVGQTHTWEINSSPAATFFDIDANGQVTVTESLNYEVLGSDTTYALTITVRDVLTSSTGVLNILIFDVNEKPTFSKDLYALSSVELPGNNVALGTPNWGVQDQDVGDTHTYYIDCGTLSGYFNMVPATGAVTQVFNYDIDQANLPTTVTCIVTVVDSGGLTDTATLVIFFTHTNDNKPRFVPARYQWFINYGAPVGTTVGQVIALDDDAGVYGILTLDLDQSSIVTDQFAIDSSGIISVAIAPNSASSAISFGETRVIKAIATDAGKESATATVTIIVRGTSTAAPTTTTKKWKTFFDSSDNVVWFVALMFFALILLVYLTWLLCTCHGKHGCDAFMSALRSACRRKKVSQGDDRGDSAYVRRDPVSQYRSSVRNPPPPKEAQSWRQGYRF